MEMGGQPVIEQPSDSPYEKDGVTLKPQADGPYADADQRTLKDETGLGARAQEAKDHDSDRSDAGEKKATAHAEGDTREEARQQNAIDKAQDRYYKAIGQPLREPITIQPDGSVSGQTQEGAVTAPQ